MDEKIILFNKTAKDKLLKGINKVADAVKITLGATGRNVVIKDEVVPAFSTNDGVYISRKIHLRDEVEEAGADIIKGVAEHTNEAVGDGTTTSIVLAQALINEGLKYKVNPLKIRAGMKKGLEVLIKEIEKLAKPIKTKEEMKQIATISAENEEIGELIADTIKEVGQDGVIKIEESKTFGLEKEIVGGIQFNSGYISPYMINKFDKLEAEYEDPLFLITDKKISMAKSELMPILEKVAQSGKKELVVIAEDITDSALATLVVNKERGLFNALGIKAPDKEVLQDLALITGATLISEETGLRLESFEMKHLGKAKKVISTKDNTTIIGGKGNVKDKIKQIKAEIEKSKQSADLLERLARLTGGIAVISVGAATEIERKAKQHKVEDALNATKAAVDGGIVAGGGVVLLRLRKTKMYAYDKDEETGSKILKKALEAPIKQMAENAGLEADKLIASILEKDEINYGYNFNTNKYEDLVENKVVDPAKVLISTLTNAVSAAGIFLTTDCVIAKKRLPLNNGR